MHSTLQHQEAHRYVKYDATNNPFIKQHIEAIKDKYITFTTTIRAWIIQNYYLAKTGSSILPAILQTLQFEGRRRLDPTANENFILSILSDSPYFEAGNAMGAMRPAGAFGSSRLNFLLLALKVYLHQWYIHYPQNQEHLTYKMLLCHLDDGEILLFLCRNRSVIIQPWMCPISEK